MKKIFTFSSVLFCASLLAQIPTDSLVGYWPFTGNANDQSGNNNNGIISNAIPSCDRCGNPNSAYDFNGTNAKITVLHNSTIDMNNIDFSISFWIKAFLPPVNDAMPLSKNQWGSWNSYQFFTNNTNPGYCTTPGQISFYTASGAGLDACSDGPVASGTDKGDSCFTGWTHVTGVWDNATGQSYLYINGVQQADIGGQSGNLSNTVDLAFGAHPNNALWFYGAIDDIRIYKTKLSQTDINALYAESCVTTGISEFSKGINYTLFPNPSSGNFNLEITKDIQDGELIICNSLGQKVHSQKIYKGENKITTSDLSSGLYNYILTEEKAQKASGKIVIE